jgi:hypothetical protein
MSSKFQHEIPMTPVSVIFYRDLMSLSVKHLFLSLAENEREGRECTGSEVSQGTCRV